ncbi:MAG: S41 family peptidase [Gemmatimonadetes bacterium]|nr:S41 family peptidase [Gemmatimonadota bacterium]
MSDELPEAPRSSPRRARAVAAGVVFVGALSVGGWWAGRDLTGAAPAPRAPIGGAHLFDQVVATIARTYVDSLADTALYARAVSGMLRELQDPYTSYLTDDRMKRLSEQLSGVYAGVGLQIDIRDGWPVVIEPIAGGPAERAGLLTGDRIVQVGKESTRGWAREETSRAVRGAPGSAVTIVVERAGQRLPFTLTRDKVHLRAVQRVALLPQGVGYIDIKTFNVETAKETSAAVDSLVKAGARALVIDLRGNPGGLLEQGVAVADLFLDRGQGIVQLRGRPGAAAQTFSDSLPQRWPTLPLAVLVDRASASASEIVAGALQDHDRALVLGVTSFGKGSAQNVYPLSSGGGLRLTIARWYTPVGRSISRPPVRNDEYDVPDTAAGPSLPDTIKPRFRTDIGRTVFGGGGITPDVIVGDTVTPAPVQALARAMGAKVGAYRDAIANQATAQRRRMSGPGDPVTPAMLDAIYQDLVARKAAPPRAVFDGAAPWIARALGYEMTRLAFGNDAEFLRRTQDDQVLQRALSVLHAARTPRDVFAGLEKSSVTVPATTP